MKKIALITGAGRGIGAATARLFSENGFDLALHYFQSEEKIHEVERACSDRGANVTLHRADLTKPDQARAMAESILSARGGVDVLVNNAGLPVPPKSFQKLDLNQVDAHFAIQVRSALEIIQVLTPKLGERKGAIVNVLSSYVFGTPPSKLIAYISAKFALLGVTKTLAVELARFGIRVNAVAPGVTDTDLIAHLPDLYKQQLAEQIPVQRLGTPEDAAKTILFLASSESAYMTGSIIPVCGGAVMP